MTALLLISLLGQIDFRNDGGYVGRARDIIDCRGGLNCHVDAGVAYLSGAGVSGGSSVIPSGLCGDGGSALGWDGVEGIAGWDAFLACARNASATSLTCKWFELTVEYKP